MPPECMCLLIHYGQKCTPNSWAATYSTCDATAGASMILCTSVQIELEATDMRDPSSSLPGWPCNSSGWIVSLLQRVSESP